MTRPGRSLLRRVAAIVLLAVCCAGAKRAAAQPPHPAVARVIVQEGDGVAYGSGTLVDVREQFGLVATNWHVVRDAAGPIVVVFPNGFRSEARALKLDEDWDLAALVIWRPPIEPARIAARAPRPGEPLTICGYGQGQYRAATGRCTEYYAPKIGLPHELVELDVEARQGDSGGPIFNSRGELAGVLFGAGQGTTLGAFGGRVNKFLSTLAADIGMSGGSGVAPPLPVQPPSVEPPTLATTPPLIAVGPRPVTQPRSSQIKTALAPAQPPRVETTAAQPVPPSQAQSSEAQEPLPPAAEPAWASIEIPATSPAGSQAFAPWAANTSPEVQSAAAGLPATPSAPASHWFEDVKSLFALIGLFAVLVAIVRVIT